MPGLVPVCFQEPKRPVVAKAWVMSSGSVEQSVFIDRENGQGCHTVIELYVVVCAPAGMRGENTKVEGAKAVYGRVG